MSAFEQFSLSDYSFINQDINEISLKPQNISSLYNSLTKAVSLLKVYISDHLFDKSIQLLNSNHQLATEFSYLYVPLMKLLCFQSVQKRNFTIANSILMHLSKIENSLVYQYKAYMINDLISNPVVLSSLFYKSKVEEYAKELIRTIDVISQECHQIRKQSLNSVNTNASDFSQFTTESNNLHKLILNNIEKELLFYQVLYLKFSDKVHDFDVFMINIEVKYDPDNTYLINLLLEEYFNTKNKIEEEKINFTSNISTSTSIIRIPIVNEVEKQLSCKYRKINLQQTNGIAFRYLKRENIDKKVLRKYRKYLFHSGLSHKSSSEIFKSFCYGEVFPPFKKFNVEFKSMNTSYLIWLLSNEEIKYYYTDFINKFMTSLMSSISLKERIDQEEVENLKRYLLTFIESYIN